MKYVVTGATGLVGGHIVREILQNNSESQVLSLGRNLDKLQVLEKEGSQIMQFDISAPLNEFDKLSDWGGDNSVWILCAAAITGAPDNELELINIEGTNKLVESARKYGVSKLILVSSIAVYGLHSDREGGFVEDDLKNPQSKYGKSKLGQEEIIENSQLEYLIFRPPFVGGPQDENVLPTFYHRMANQKMPTFSKKGNFGYIDARDIAKSVKKAIDLGIKNESFNIQGSPLELDQLIDIIAKVTDLKPPYGKKYPYFIIMAFGTLMDIIAWVQRKSRDRSISRYRIKSLTSNRILDTTKAINMINFSPMYSVEQSIADWFKLYQLK